MRRLRGLVQSLIFRTAMLLRARARRRAVPLLRARWPDLTARYQRFVAVHGSRPKTMGEDERGVFLLGLLDGLQPRRIVELGGGVSTIWFNLWAAERSGVHVVTLEQTPAWADAIRAAVPEADSVMSDIVETGPGRWRYRAHAPAGADLVYVDGPSVKLEQVNSRFTAASHGEKAVCADVLHILDTGSRPRAIVVDGRVDTVDALIAHPAIQDAYDYRTEFVHAFTREEWRQALAMRRQTVFLLK